MARNLIFKIKGAEFSAVPVKVDRSKLYGWTALKGLDDSGKECKIVNMDESGTLIIPKGGLGLGIITPEGEWAERSSLKAVMPDGSDAAQVPSSYSAPITLKKTADMETFLDHKITAVYQLSAPDDFINAVGDNIFTFTYSFRDSFKGESAFIMTAQGAQQCAIFMLIGQEMKFEMLSLSQAQSIDDENSDEEEEDSDELDFSMM